MCVASSTTGHAMLASSDCFQRVMQTHQRSPGTRPGKPYIGNGVERSLPMYCWWARNSAVTWQQMVCSPSSSGPVLQQPSR